MADFVDSPMDFQKITGSSGKDYKGSPGKYDGIPGWPGRTNSPSGVPEKFLEDAMPGVQPPATGKDGGNMMERTGRSNEQSSE